MVTGGAVCSNWACTESVRGEVSDGLPYLDPRLPFSFLCASSPVRKGSLLQKSLSFLLTRALSDMLSLQVEVNADMHILHTCAAFPFFCPFPVSAPSRP